MINREKGKVGEMKKSRYTEEPIAFALKQVEFGTMISEVPKI